MTGNQILTAVVAIVPSGSEDEFVAGYAELNRGPKPDGLLRSELLSGQNGRWLIHTLWRDREAVMSARRPGAAPPAVALCERVGAEHSHELFMAEGAWHA
jgi:hypothetical protein